MKSWLAAFVVLLSALTPPAIDRANCRSDVEGITYCVEDRGETHLLLIDLTHPHIRLQTVMANDVLDVRPIDEQRERVADMAQRYRDDGGVIAINGDYFGVQRGPEGPTVVQGQRLDTLLTIATNPSHYQRTTLVVSRFEHALIARLNPRNLLAPILYRDVVFNAISGGPIILRGGQPIFEGIACLLDRIPINSCHRRRQTVAGLDATGTILYLAVSTDRSSGEMAQLLRDYGADTALKLDGGGSSQLWYDGRTLLDSDRGVANALLVFVDKRPRHAAQLINRLSVPVVQPDERATVEIDLQNTGFLDWTTDRGYGLRSIAGASLADHAFALLPGDVLPGDVGKMVLQVNGSSWPGVYESIWQMTGSSEKFGAEFPLRVVVAPAGADDLTSKIRSLLAASERSSPRRFEQNWPGVAQRIRQMIKQWKVEHSDPREVCSGRNPC